METITELLNNVLFNKNEAYDFNDENDFIEIIPDFTEDDTFEIIPNIEPTNVTKDIIYVLECVNNKYYVGRTKKPIDERFSEHLSGNGSEWTKKYEPTKIIEITKMKGDWDEDNKTKEIMAKFGIDNVRGGSYSQIILPEYKIKSLMDEINTSSEKCFKCGEIGHYIKNCKREICLKCKRVGHDKSNCYAKTDTSGNYIGNNEKCYRCKRVGHYANACKYKTNLWGKNIIKN